MPPRPVTELIELTPEKRDAVVSTAVAWFADHGRDLPWRHTRDPWKVLVSEVMLQQLRVARTAPFYERVVERFPTPASLAAVPLRELLDVWGDLGRYRAAAALHRTAHVIVAGHGGEVPDDPAVLATLPGLGPYTAGAVACFAFERDVAFLDTNARRVLHRVFVGPDVPAPTAKPAALRDLAERLVPAARAWAWNQALIEVGALVCTARVARCDGCPLSDLCLARPTIRAALAAGERVTRPTRYAGTNRQHRDQVLRALRVAEDRIVSIDAVGRSVREGYTPADRPWLASVVDSLAADGLVERRAAPGRALREDQVAYVVDDEPPADEGDWISLS